jgi:hypothetical protein
MLLSFWYVGGLFIDGWAHNHGRTDDSFFTIWHAVFYSGFGVLALFYTGTLFRNVQAGKRWQDALPKGHHLALFGIAVFGFGGVFDMLWHTVFGVEEDIEALLSPSHLTLVVGMVLVLSGAFRSFQHRENRGDWWGTWLAPVLSMSFTISVLLFILQYISLTDSVIGMPTQVSRNSDTGYLLLIYGLTTMLINSAVLMAGTLLLVREGRPPFGAITLFWGVTFALVATQDDGYIYIILALIAGLSADVLIRLLNVRFENVGRFALFAFVVPVIYFLSHFAMVQLQAGRLGWTIDVWTGATFMAGAVGMFIAYLLRPSVRQISA